MVDEARKSEQPCHLYRHFDAEGVLLYVGISQDAMFRQSQHEKRAAWFGEVATIKVESFSSRALADAAETSAIRLEKPRHNIAKVLGVLPARQPRRVRPRAVAEPLVDPEVNFDRTLAYIEACVRFERQNGIGNRKQREQARAQGLYPTL